MNKTLYTKDLKAEKEATQKVIDEVENKIQALNFIDTLKKEMGDFRLWRPFGDCPYFNKIPTYYICNCYLERLKHKPCKCSVINTADICINKLNKNGRL